MFRKALLAILAVCAIVIPLCACRMRRGQRAAPETLGDLAWDGRSGREALVYLPEREGEGTAAGYVPFLVVARKYQEDALLLREQVLDAPARFNDYSAYYADSEIDRYLNGPYLSRLSGLPTPVLDTEVEITTEASLGVSGTDTEAIGRKVFLLSCTELCEDGVENTGREGSALKYFRDASNRLATGEDGTASGWWLRSPDTYYLSCPFGIGPDGSIGSGNAYNKNGVRPAFRLAACAGIEAREDIVAGKTVYVLSGTQSAP